MLGPIFWMDDKALIIIFSNLDFAVKYAIVSSQESLWTTWFDLH